MSSEQQQGQEQQEQQLQNPQQQERSYVSPMKNYADRVYGSNQRSTQGSYVRQAQTYQSPERRAADLTSSYIQAQLNASAHRRERELLTQQQLINDLTTTNLARENDLLKRQVADLKIQNNKLTEDNIFLNTQALKADGLERDNADLLRRLSSVGPDLSPLVIEKSHQIDNLKRDLLELGQENRRQKALASQVPILEREIVSFKEIVERFQLQEVNLKQDLQYHLQQLESQIQLNRELKLDNDRLNLDLQTHAKKSELENERWQSNQELLNSQNEKNITRIQNNFQIEIDNLNNQNAQLKEDFFTEAQAHNKTKGELQNLRLEYDNITTQFRNQVRTNTDLRESSLQDNLKKNEEKTQLEQALRDEIEQLKHSHHDEVLNLSKAHQEEVEKLKNKYKERHTNERVQLVRQKTMEQDNYQIEVDRLRSSINELQIHNTNQGNLLQVSERQLKDVINKQREEIQNRDLEITKREQKIRELEAKLDEFSKQCQQDVDNLQDRVRVLTEREEATNKSLTEQIEALKLETGNEINALRDEINQREAAIEGLNHQIDILNRDLNDLQKKQTETYAESEYWKRNSQKLEQEKILLNDQHQIQAEAARRTHLRDLEEKNLEKKALYNVIQEKETENQVVKQQHLKAVVDVGLIERQKRQKEIEAEIERRRALDAEHRRVRDLATKDYISAQEKRSLSIEKELLHTHVHQLNNQLVHKEIEANEWKRSYHELSLSPIRNRSPERNISPSRISPTKSVYQTSTTYVSPYKRY